MRKSFYLFGVLAGCFMLLSAVARAAAPVISANPKNDTVCAPTTNITDPVFVVTASDTTHLGGKHINTLTYQWQVSTNGGTTWSDASGSLYQGETTNSFKIISPTLAQNGYMFRSIVYDIYLDSTIVDSVTSRTSLSAILIVDLTYNGSISGTYTVCVGAEVTLTNTSPGGIWSVGNDSASISLTGIVTGLLTKTDTTSGHDKVFYTISANKCPTYKDSVNITINPLPHVGVITGSANILCESAVVTLSDTVLGGTWSASNTSVGTVGSTGVFTSISQGFDTVKYSATRGMCSAYASYVIRVDSAATTLPVTGPAAVCVGSTAHLMDANDLGTWTWSVSNSSASVNSAGVVEGLASGIDTVIYSFMNACSSSPVDTFFAITIDTVLAHGVISGATSVCSGSWINLAETVAGGTWLSGNSGIAVADMSGDVTGVSQGSAVISYFLSNSCGISAATYTIDVVDGASAIVGNDSVGIGGLRNLFDATTGGTWSSSDAAIISIDGTGTAEGVGTGSATITYTVDNACGITYTTEILYTGIPTAGTIHGADSVCAGHTILLSDNITGGVGVWASANTAIATVDGSGSVAGIGYGPVSISYTFTNGFGSATSIFSAFVNAKPVDSILVSAVYSYGGSYPFYGFTKNDTGWIATPGTWTSSNPAVGAFYSTTGTILSITGYGSTTITYSATNTCGTTDTSFVINIIDVSNVNQVTNTASELTVYPNPSTGDFTINLMSAIKEQASVTITNIVGEKVKEFSMATNEPLELMLDQPDGIYFLTATSSTGKYSAKITIAK